MVRPRASGRGAVYASVRPAVVKGCKFEDCGSLRENFCQNREWSFFGLVGLGFFMLMGSRRREGSARNFQNAAFFPLLNSQLQ